MTEYIKTDYITQKSIDSDPPCANRVMDDWEEKYLTPEQRGGSRLLYCGCPRCKIVTL